MKKKIKTVKKPWGKEIWFAEHKSYLGKILIINKSHRLSLQYHKYKHETMYCVKGRCVIEANGKKVLLAPGQSIIFSPRTVHRLSAPFNRVTLFEVSTSHPDDVFRVKDDYGRKSYKKC
ncbi:MAG: cupin domain-containing protein [bacterium]